MRPPETRRAVAAALSAASTLGLAADEARMLNDSNRLVLRLMPANIVARMGPASYEPGAQLEVDVAGRLAATGSPITTLDPRVEPRISLRDGFVIGFWTWYAPAPSQEISSADYAGALERLHAGLRTIDVDAPHYTERVAATERDIATSDLTPGLTGADRGLLANTLHTHTRSIIARGAPEQLLHGEPHPWNVLNTTTGGPLFIDFENCVRGPIEFDLAWAPEDVAARYPDLDPALLDECRGLRLAIVATCRWHRDDQHPSGRRGGIEYLRALREGPPWSPIVRWDS
jgi:hypothetical protein